MRRLYDKSGYFTDEAITIDIDIFNLLENYLSKNPRIKEYDLRDLTSLIKSAVDSVIYNFILNRQFELTKND